jgi:hypothetical protein
VSKAPAIIGLLAGLVVSVAIGMTPWATALAGDNSTLLPVIPPALKGEQCVEPTEVMRRDHMRFLMHQRDETVHSGIRGAKHSLVGCIACHAQSDAAGAAIPVNAEGQFCESCHGFAGVSMDCFECHASVPARQQALGTLPRWMSSPAVAVAHTSARGAD